MFQERMNFPQPVEDVIDTVVQELTNLGFFSDPNIPEGYTSNCEIHLRNYTGEVLMKSFLNGEELLFNESEFEEMLQKSIIASCLDSLLDQNLIDTIEDEHGENVFWLKK